MPCKLHIRKKTKREELLTEACSQCKYTVNWPGTRVSPVVADCGDEDKQTDSAWQCLSNSSITSTAKELVDENGPGRSRQRSKQCSVSGGKECIAHRIAQRIAILIAGRTMMRGMKSGIAVDCRTCRTIKHQKRFTGK